MTGELSLPDKTKVETIVGSQLQPGETIVGVCKENRKLLPIIQWFWPTRIGLNCAKLMNDINSFAPPTLTSMMWMLGVIAFLVVLVVMVMRDLHPGWTIVYALASMIAVYHIMFRQVQGRAFAITNQRIVCISLSSSKLVGSLDLKCVKSVEVFEENDGTTDVIVRVEQRPGAPYALRAVDDAERVKAILVEALNSAGAS